VLAAERGATKSGDIAGIQETLAERQHPPEPVVTGPTLLAISYA
jgi:hypothetical protein